jgi:hypothetical protein
MYFHFGFNKMAPLAHVCVTSEWDTYPTSTTVEQLTGIATELEWLGETDL